MQETLLLAGIACVMAAIVGGGLKAFGFEIPALESGTRQAVLGILGLALIGFAVAAGGSGLFSGGANEREVVSPSQNGGQTSDADPSSSHETDDPPHEGDASVSPSADFAGGSTRAYAADFTAWPRPTTEHGRVSLGFGNALVLEPSSNTWIGPGQTIEIPPVGGDIVCDLRFRIEERASSAALKLSLQGPGNDADALQLFLSVWDTDNVTYTLQKARVRSGGGLGVPHLVTEEEVANRAQLPAAAKSQDWARGSELTVKRVGGDMQVFVNDQFVRDFPMASFPVSKLSLGAAFASKIVVTSLEIRVPSG